MTSPISAIHAGLRQLGIDEDARRDLYQRLTGVDGLTKMTAAQQDAVLQELRRQGFKPASRRQNGRPKLSGRFARKLQALWIAGYNLGVFRDQDDAALEKFVRRQTGIERERFLHHEDDARKVIEALKGWIAREGGVDWSEHSIMQPWQRVPGYKIARAQWAILNPKGGNDFWPVVTDLVNQPVMYRRMTTAEWITVMNAFGARIRKDGLKIASRIASRDAA